MRNTIRNCLVCERNFPVSQQNVLRNNWRSWFCSLYCFRHFKENQEEFNKSKQEHKEEQKALFEFEEIEEDKK